MNSFQQMFKLFSKLVEERVLLKLETCLQLSGMLKLRALFYVQLVGTEIMSETTFLEQLSLENSELRQKFFRHCCVSAAYY